MLRTIESQIEYHWTNEEDRKPLIIRGARQVGKTFVVRQYGKRFSEQMYFNNFIEINFESQPEIKVIFEKNLDPKRIIIELSLVLGKTITPRNTLLFFDEIQQAPNALAALRYFYEEMPELRVIAAGSLLDFAIDKGGIPVGRVTSLYMHPMSFYEFLLAIGEYAIHSVIHTYSANNPASDIVHEKLLGLIGQYIAIGGMPGVVKVWAETKDAYRCMKIQQSILDSYRQDFQKYAARHQLECLDMLLGQVSSQIGRQFKFSKSFDGYRKRDLMPCMALLDKSNVITPVYHTSANGLPLGAEVNPDKFKAVFLDVGLAQRLVGLDLKEWFLNPKESFINQGNMVESFVGQELLAYSDPIERQKLYYWHRETNGSTAEVDYVRQIGSDIVPIEVKSGTTGTLKSMHEFFKAHKKTQYGVRFSARNYSENDKIRSYPLYAIADAIKSYGKSCFTINSLEKPPHFE